MKDYGVWEPEAIKVQSMKTAIEVRVPPCISIRQRFKLLVRSFAY